MNRIAIAGLCVGILLPSMVRGQGVYMESVNIEKGQDPAVLAADPAQVTKTYLAPGKYRGDMGNGTVSIVRLDKDLMYILNTKKTTYSEMSLEEMKSQMKAAGDSLAATRAQLRKQLESMPEDQRKMVEKSMGGMLAEPKGAAKPLDVVATGETKTICGYSCKKYVARDGDEVVLTAWATRDVMETEAMRKDWEKMMDALSPMASTVGGRSFEAFRKLDGLPLETEHMGIHTVTTKVERRAFPETDFEVPEGYVREQSPFAGVGDAAGALAVPRPVPGPKKVEPMIPPKAVPPAAAPKVTPPAAEPKAVAKFCSGCGTKLGAAAKFCTNCGKKVGE